MSMLWGTGAAAHTQTARAERRRLSFTVRRRLAVLRLGLAAILPALYALLAMAIVCVLVLAGIDAVSGRAW